MSNHCKLKRNGVCSAPQPPINPKLASENNKKLEALKAERARQDAMFGPQPPKK